MCWDPETWKAVEEVVARYEQEMGQRIPVSTVGVIHRLAQRGTEQHPGDKKQTAEGGLLQAALWMRRLIRSRWAMGALGIVAKKTTAPLFRRYEQANGFLDADDVLVRVLKKIERCQPLPPPSIQEWLFLEPERLHELLRRIRGFFRLETRHAIDSLRPFPPAPTVVAEEDTNSLDQVSAEGPFAEPERALDLFLDGGDTRAVREFVDSLGPRPAEPAGRARTNAENAEWFRYTQTVFAAFLIWRAPTLRHVLRAADLAALLQSAHQIVEDVKAVPCPVFRTCKKTFCLAYGMQAEEGL